MCNARAAGVVIGRAAHVGWSLVGVKHIVLLLPPSFPPLPSTEGSELPLRTSVAPPQCAKTVTTASIPVIPNK
ncbi:MAG TPA: hypothetical protein VIJ22_17535 [Polyangiaceae bacterium]